MANVKGFALMMDGTIKEMSASADGKLPGRGTLYREWHPDRIVIETIVSNLDRASVGAPASAPAAGRKTRGGER